MSSPFHLSISELHQAYLEGKTTPIEVTEAFLERIKDNPKNAFLTICDDRARKQAKAATDLLKNKGKQALEQQPLLGVVLGVKDILCLDGVRTTCASKMLENYVPPYTATSMLRLENAGAISIGKLNMDEFAMGGSNENSAFGPVEHPDFPDRVPGGSSGASATAVKAGYSTVALGTDTGGSVRLPASYCGIVAMKPTYGRVSRYGLIAFASSLDQIGPMTKNVEDSARVLQVMGGHDPKDSTSVNIPQGDYIGACKTPTNWKGLKIGVPKEYFVDGLQPEVKKIVETGLDAMKSAGATIVPISLPYSKYAVSVYYVVAVSEASSNLARFDSVRFGPRRPEQLQAKDLKEFYKKARAHFGPEVKRRIILGTYALSSGYYDAYYGRACQVRRLIKEDFDKAFNEVDIIAGPVSTGTAFKIGEKTNDPLKMYLNDLYTIPVNLAGLPALSVPCGKDSQGLPIGMHLIGKAFKEEALLNVASGFERLMKGGA